MSEPDPHKPIEIRHTRPAFDSSRKPITQSSFWTDKDVHFVSEPTKEHPHRIVSMHYTTPDGRPVHEYFDPEGPVSEGIIDPKPMLLPEVPTRSLLDDDGPTEPTSPPPSKPKRFKAPPCRKCKGPAKVTSTRREKRHLVCKNPKCGHRWSVPRKRYTKKPCNTPSS